ncbi:hypothetical protein [Mycobacterium sp. M23085]|uniref:hypothetical protein n=1 Tax=Mycobacterium sp. M23085 TaxID=3378087 RepID=UPI003877D2E8
MSRSGLSDGDVHGAYYCVSEVVRGRRRCGQPVPAWLRALYDRLDAAVRAARTRPQHVAEGEQSEVVDKWIGSPDAAALLGWSKRQVQRRAADLDGQIAGGRWLFREAVVIEYAEGRRS